MTLQLQQSVKQLYPTSQVKINQKISKLDKMADSFIKRADRNLNFQKMDRDAIDAIAGVKVRPKTSST